MRLVKDGDEISIIKYPSVALSNTWFGDFFEGELCYAVKSRALRRFEDLRITANRMTCPFEVRNKSDDSLPIEKICLHVKHLNVYSGETRLWTNKVSVKYRGHDHHSQITYEDAPPEVPEKCQLLRDAQESPEDGFLKRTFSMPSFNLF